MYIHTYIHTCTYLHARTHTGHVEVAQIAPQLLRVMDTSSVNTSHQQTNHLPITCQFDLIIRQIKTAVNIATSCFPNNHFLGKVTEEEKQKL